jgi:hypothetical protein
MTKDFRKVKSTNRFRWYVERLFDEALPIVEELPGFSLTFVERQGWESENTGRYLHEIYPGLTTSALRNIDMDFGSSGERGELRKDARDVFLARRTKLGLEPVALSATFKEFLSCTNGARLFANHWGICGIAYPPPKRLAVGPYSLFGTNCMARSAGMGPRDILIGTTCGLVSHYENADSGNVCARLVETGETIRTWSSFEEWFRSEFERLYILFDKNGKFLGKSFDEVLPY